MVMLLGCFGLMADLYDMGVINLIRPSLEADFGKMTATQDATLTSSVLFGAFVGQVLFGSAADYCGRYITFILTALVVFISALAGAMGQDGWMGMDIYTFLTLCRFTMGLGIGGEYPLSATNTVENVSAESSGFALAFVMGGMSVGSLLGPLVVMTLSAGFGLSDSLVWRGAMGFAAIMAGISAILRWICLEETASFQEAKDTVGEDPAEESRTAALWAMRKTLLGTGGSWFLYNIVTYGTGMFSTTIFHSAPGIQSAMMVMALGIFSIAGVLASLVLVQRMTMRNVQMLGLTIMGGCFFGLSYAMALGPFEPMRVSIPRGGSIHYVCISLFAMNMAADSMGPSVSTYAVPAQAYPTRIRGMAHGISAAVGKLGAFVGTFLFPFVQKYAGIESVLSMVAIVCGAAVLWTWYFTPAYWAPEYEELLKCQKGSSLLRQAQAAERLLFADSKDKRETLSLIV